MISDRQPYDHVQQGPKLLAAFPLVALVAVIIGMTTSKKPVDPIAWVVVVLAIGIATVSILVFSRLRIEVRDGVVRWSFGTGFPRFTLPISEIRSSAAVTNPWFFGVGIHLTPMGMLYNVWGRSAVEIIRSNGRRVRLGTDEPHALLAAINANR